MAKFIADSMTLTIADTSFSGTYSLCVTSAKVDKSYTLVELNCASPAPVTERLSGPYTWTMDISGNYDSSGLDLQNLVDGTSHAIELDSVDGLTYSGDGFVDISLSFSTTDASTFDMTITGDGALTEA